MKQSSIKEAFRVSLFVLVSCLSVAGDDAARAGAFCAASLEGGVTTAASEDEARKAAIAWWSSRAGSLGRGYENWDTAADKNVSCKPAVNGKTSCRAAARPCLPDGVLPENVPGMKL